MKDLDKNVVEQLVESASWASVDIKPVVNESEDIESTEDQETLDVVEVEDDSNEGLWYDEDGNVFYVSEEEDVFECLEDEEGDVYFIDENDLLYAVYEDEDDLVLEEVDGEDFELLVEDSEDEGED
jgi:hypothetical protein